MVFVHISERFGAVELEDVGENFVDKPRGVNFVFFPVSGGGGVVGHAGCNFEEESYVGVVFNEEAEEVGEVNEAFEFVHVVLEIFFASGVFPVFDGLGTESEHFVEAIEFAELVEDVHGGDVSEIFLARVVIRILDCHIDYEILILDFLQFGIGTDFGHVLHRYLGREQFFKFRDGDFGWEDVNWTVTVPGEREFG